MAVLRGLLMALLPGGLCIYDRSPHIQNTATLLMPQKLWEECESNTNLCVPAAECEEKTIVYGDKIVCPLDWQCCDFGQGAGKMNEDKSYKRTRRLAHWSEKRKKDTYSHESSINKLIEKCTDRKVKHEVCWKLLSGVCGSVCEDKDHCHDNCRVYKAGIVKLCQEDQKVNWEASYSLLDEICHTAKSESEGQCHEFKKVNSNAKTSKKHQRLEVESIGQYCEQESVCGGDDGCKINCNRCLQDKHRHRCLENEKCKAEEDGCTRLCRMIPPGHHAEIGKAIDLMNTYTTQPWSFSEWVIASYMIKTKKPEPYEALEVGETFKRDKKTCRIYYDDEDEDKVEEVKMLAVMREPVNIRMNRWGYSQLRMMESFPEWKGSAYDEQVQVNSGKLPPNIAIGCDTPVITYNPALTYEDVHSLSAADLNWETYGRFRPVHILNVIWPVFGSDNSPDFAYFFDGKDLVSTEELKGFYEKVLTKIFAAATVNGAKWVVLDGFGLDQAVEAGFANPDVIKVMTTEFANALATVADKVRNKKSNVRFFLQRHKFEQVYAHADSIIKGSNDKDVDHKIFKTEKVYDPEKPELFMSALKNNFNPQEKTRILYVSSWDAYSFIGRGNAKDDTLNGKVGRATALAVLGWPEINRDIQIERVSQEGDSKGEAFFRK